MLIQIHVYLHYIMMINQSNRRNNQEEITHLSTGELEEELVELSISEMRKG